MIVGEITVPTDIYVVHLFGRTYTFFKYQDTFQMICDFPLQKVELCHLLHDSVTVQHRDVTVWVLAKV